MSQLKQPIFLKKIKKVINTIPGLEEQIFACRNKKRSDNRKRLARTVLIFTERSDQLSRATDRVPGLPANPGYAQ